MLHLLHLSTSASISFESRLDIHAKNSLLKFRNKRAAFLPITEKIVFFQEDECHEKKRECFSFVLSKFSEQSTTRDTVHRSRSLIASLANSFVRRRRPLTPAPTASFILRQPSGPKICKSARKRFFWRGTAKYTRIVRRVHGHRLFSTHKYTVHSYIFQKKRYQPI